MGSHPDDIDNFTNTNRINNSIKYTTPSYRGFSAGILYSFGGIAGNPSQNQIWSVGFGYTLNPVSFGASYLNARDPNVSFYGNTPNKGTATANNIGSFGSTASPQSNPVFAGFASAKTLEIIGLGSSVTINQLILAISASNVRFGGLGASSGPNPLGYTGQAIFNTVDVNARYWLSPFLQLGIGYVYTHRNSVNNKGSAAYD